ncbi:MAG TPA: BrnT family toxin [Synechococcales bacterium UBA10510]|nr:BrnT family toxin [Synechococcales bacterium UBA10510]
MIALVPKTAILHFVAFVDRSSVRRIISLRRANRREANHYVSSTEEILRGDPIS